jgi:hypothetical protein
MTQPPEISCQFSCCERFSSCWQTHLNVEEINLIIRKKGPKFINRQPQEIKHKNNGRKNILQRGKEPMHQCEIAEGPSFFFLLKNLIIKRSIPISLQTQIKYELSQVQSVKLQQKK